MEKKETKYSEKKHGNTSNLQQNEEHLKDDNSQKKKNVAPLDLSKYTLENKIPERKISLSSENSGNESFLKYPQTLSGKHKFCPKENLDGISIEEKIKETVNVMGPTEGNKSTDNLSPTKTLLRKSLLKRNNIYSPKENKEDTKNQDEAINVDSSNNKELSNVDECVSNDIEYENKEGIIKEHDTIKSINKEQTKQFVKETSVENDTKENDALTCKVNNDNSIKEIIKQNKDINVDSNSNKESGLENYKRDETKELENYTESNKNTSKDIENKNKVCIMKEHTAIENINKEHEQLVKKSPSGSKMGTSAENNEHIFKDLENKNNENVIKEVISSDNINKGKVSVKKTSIEYDLKDSCDLANKVIDNNSQEVIEQDEEANMDTNYNDELSKQKNHNINKMENMRNDIESKEIISKDIKNESKENTFNEPKIIENISKEQAKQFVTKTPIEFDLKDSNGISRKSSDDDNKNEIMEQIKEVNLDTNYNNENSNIENSNRNKLKIIGNIESMEDTAKELENTNQEYIKEEKIDNINEKEIDLKNNTVIQKNEVKSAGKLFQEKKSKTQQKN